MSYAKTVLAATVALAAMQAAEAAEPPVVIKDFEFRRNPKLAGKKAFFYIDDVVWVFRDLTRQCPKSLFDNAFLGVLKEAHERYGMKIQLNCFTGRTSSTAPTSSLSAT